MPALLRGLQQTPQGLARRRVERLRLTLHDTSQPIANTLSWHRLEAISPKPWTVPARLAKCRQTYRVKLTDMRIRLDGRQQSFSNTLAGCIRLDRDVVQVQVIIQQAHGCKTDDVTAVPVDCDNYPAGFKPVYPQRKAFGDMRQSRNAFLTVTRPH